jgi:hypothetical protein
VLPAPHAPGQELTGFGFQGQLISGQRFSGHGVKVLLSGEVEREVIDESLHIVGGAHLLLGRQADAKQFVLLCVPQHDFTTGDFAKNISLRNNLKCGDL